MFNQWTCTLMEVFDTPVGFTLVFVTLGPVVG